MRGVLVPECSTGDNLEVETTQCLSSKIKTLSQLFNTITTLGDCSTVLVCPEYGPLVGLVVLELDLVDIVGLNERIHYVSFFYAADSDDRLTSISPR